MAAKSNDIAKDKIEETNCQKNWQKNAQNMNTTMYKDRARQHCGQRHGARQNDL